MIDVAAEQIKIIKNILQKYVPDCEVRAFGSRVKGTARKHSDLDLALVDKDVIPRKILFALKEEFENSDLPFRVDLTDWHRISNEFQEIILKQYEAL
jgi:uncharacterized protein